MVENIRLSTNVGYGAACNTGFSDSRCDILVAMNPDAFVDEGWADGVARAFASPAVGAVGGKARHTASSCLYHAGAWVEGPLMQGRHFGHGESDMGQHDSPKSVPYVVGCAIALSRNAFEKVGGFDPAYFLYFEEVDLCFRLRRAGYDILYAPGATFAHDGGSVTQQRSLAFYARYHTSRYRFIIRNYDPVTIEEIWLPAESEYAFRKLSYNERRGLIEAARAFESQRVHQPATIGPNSLVDRIAKRLSTISNMHDSATEFGTETDVYGWL